MYNIILFYNIKYIIIFLNNIVFSHTKKKSFMLYCGNYNIDITRMKKHRQ